VSGGKENGNISALPLLAADGFHQLAGSLTLGGGATDGFSGTTDIDGGPRVEGAVDIGADELVRGASTTALSCEPASSEVGHPVDCTVRVEGPAGLGVPGGVVTLTQGAAAIGSCKLFEDAAQIASCRSTISLGVGSGQQIVAGFAGDEAHRASSGATAIDIKPAPPAAQPAPSAPAPTKPAEIPLTPAPNTLLKRHPKARSASQKAIFSFTASQTGARFQCKLDRKGYRSCRSPFKAKVKPGRHVLRVRAIGPGGTDLSPAIFRWKVLG
jgi:hypothetical protein